MMDYYVFCDICGKRCNASEATRLSKYTGRGGLLVCPEDVDKIDYGLIPYKTSSEKSIPYANPNHTNASNATTPIDPETSTEIGV